MALREIERQPIIEIIESEQTLPQKIREVVLAPGTVQFDKRREISGIIQNALDTLGSFLRTTDGRIFFFSKDGRKVLDVEQTEFRRTLTQISGLSCTETFFKFSLDVLQAKMSKTAQLAEIHTFSYFNLADGFLAVSDGAGGMWVRPRGGDWCEANNGDEGIFFLDEPLTTPFVPQFRSDSAALDWYLRLFHFSDGVLSTDDARALLSVFLFQQFFPPLRRTRMIPAFLGPQGSGKTTGLRLVGRLLLGPNFEVSGVQRDREDAFIAAVSDGVILGVDNADSRIPWLPDTLALYATGQKFKLRKLYTTNEAVSYSPRAMLLISSRDPQFNRPDVSERLLPFHFARLENYQAEYELFGELDARRPEVVGDILQRVAKFADSLPRTKPSPVPFRMADFATFGYRILEPSGESTDWLELLKRVESAQASFAADGDGVLLALRSLIDREGEIYDMDVGELFKRVKQTGEAESLPLPRNAQGFGRYLNTHRTVLELELGVQVTEIHHGRGKRSVTIKRR
jgi:hypothetical protein